MTDERDIPKPMPDNAPCAPWRSEPGRVVGRDVGRDILDRADAGDPDAVAILEAARAFTSGATHTPAAGSSDFPVGGDLPPGPMAGGTPDTFDLRYEGVNHDHIGVVEVVYPGGEKKLLHVSPGDRIGLTDGRVRVQRRNLADRRWELASWSSRARGRRSFGGMLDRARMSFWDRPALSILAVWLLAMTCAAIVWAVAS